MPDGSIVPQLAAPGVQIRIPQLNGLYGYASGTSLSTAQTAGAAALLLNGLSCAKTVLFSLAPA